MIVAGAAALGHRAQQRPFGVVHAAGKPPSAREPVAALDLDRRSGGGIGRGDQRVRRLAPDVCLRLFRKQGDITIVLAVDVGHPGLGGVPFGERHDCFAQRGPVEFVPAEPPGLAGSMDSGLDDVGDGFRRDPAGLLGRRRAVAELRRESPGAADENFAGYAAAGRRSIIHPASVAICRPLLNLRGATA